MGAGRVPRPPPSVAAPAPDRRSSCLREVLAEATEDLVARCVPEKRAMAQRRPGGRASRAAGTCRNGRCSLANLAAPRPGDGRGRGGSVGLAAGAGDVNHVDRRARLPGPASPTAAGRDAPETHPPRRARPTARTRLHRLTLRVRRADDLWEEWVRDDIPAASANLWESDTVESSRPGGMHEPRPLFWGRFPGDADGLPRRILRQRKRFRSPSSDRTLRTSSVCFRIPCLR